MSGPRDWKKLGLQAAAVLTFPLRLAQLLDIVIAGYGVCYLVYMHTAHTCRKSYCDPYYGSPDSIPVGEVIMIIAVRCPPFSQA